MPKLNTIICTVLAIKGSSPLQFHQPVTVRLVEFLPPLEIDAIQATPEHELVVWPVGNTPYKLEPEDLHFDKVLDALYNRCEQCFGDFMKQHASLAV